MHRTEAGTERKRSWWLQGLTGDEALAAEYVKAHARKVADVMTRHVITASPETPLHENFSAPSGTRSLARLIVAPHQDYDEPEILSYAISPFCPTSADGLQVIAATAAGIRQETGIT